MWQKARSTAKRYPLVIALVIAACGRHDAESVSGTRNAPLKTTESSAAAAEKQILTMALERVLRQVAVADIRVDPDVVCVAGSPEPGLFDEAPAAVLPALREHDPRVVPAASCRTQEAEWGRIVNRDNNKPAILISARCYVFEREGRAFVLASWYANTMRAQRFIFTFRMRDGQWRMDDGSRLGVV